MRKPPETKEKQTKKKSLVGLRLGIIGLKKREMFSAYIPKSLCDLIPSLNRAGVYNCSAKGHDLIIYLYCV